VISPLLANVYLHYVFDLWAERWRRHEATGGMMIVRYADDIVVGFAHEIDARRFWDAMRKRFEEFALSLHPEKTRLIEFGRQAADRRGQRGLGKPETFNFLGFTHICGRSRHGKFLLVRKSRRDRMRGKLKETAKAIVGTRRAVLWVAPWVTEWQASKSKENQWTWAEGPSVKLALPRNRDRAIWSNLRVTANLI
jgi:RNA-directed DNA polymerase